MFTLLSPLCSASKLVIKPPNCGLWALLWIYAENTLLSPTFVAERKASWLLGSGKYDQLIYFQLLYSFVMSKNTPSPTHT